MHSFRSIALALLLALITAPAFAQTSYPERPIHIIVPFPAGGPSDVMARLIADKMSADFGQGVVIDNRPGANTLIGAEFAAKSPPDGYTLLMAIDSTLVMNQYLYSKLPYDPIKDFAPITLVAKTIGLMVVNASSDIKTVKDLIAKAKATPGKLNCGAGTITTKLTCVLFADKAGIDTVLLPYNGSAEVAHGILTKSVDFVFDGPSAVLPLIRSGDLRALAKLDARPFPAIPDLQTLPETAGVDLGDVTVWLGLVAPRGTPAPIIDKLAHEVAKILSDPDVKAKADAVGLGPATTETPAEFAAFIQHEAARWPEVVKKSGLHFD
ncbi:MAG TPA: tripartite tricarboxylate transporter substrate binding protein [Xanthobacteraceae bacterium]|jgi:tripartite-type tricarboxylate transporter receptor subunit TctC|nr:tripartite tricarboxylate transporter substrate binding protein [Xanthobacteraceae bacterium]